MSQTKRVFLTGASRGIGLATARLLCERGCQVWGSARDASRLPVLAGFHPVALDLTDVESVRAAVEQVWTEAGAIDVLIQNAGAGVFGSLEEVPVERAADQLDLLVLGPVRVLQHALPRLRAQGSGLVVHVGSLAGEFCVPFEAHYSAGKAALGRLTEGLALEVAPHGLRVVEIRPGDHNTAFYRAMERVVPEGSPYREALGRVWARIEENHLTGPDPARVAAAIWRVMHMRRPPPVVDCGSFFQAVLAPLGTRLLPRRVVRRLNRRYYGL